MTATTAPLVFLGLSADSCSPGRRAWEIAMIHVQHPNTTDQIVTERHLFIEVPNLNRADPGILHDTGYWNRHPHGRTWSRPQSATACPTPATVEPVHTPAKAAVEVVRHTHEAIVVSLDTHTDIPTLERMIRGADLLPTWTAYLDLPTLTIGHLLSRKSLLEVDLADRTPAALSCAVGTRPPASHGHSVTARDQAIWAARWLTALKAAA